MNWAQELEQVQDKKNEILSFEEYMDLFENSPVKQARPTCLYFKEMFDHFGKDEDGHFKLFLKEYPESPPIHGQFTAIKDIYQNLINFCEEGFNNKFLLLVGPNGSSKTSIIRKIMCGAEEYSLTADGALYTYSWVFPIDTFIKGQLGLIQSHQTSKNLKSYAHIEDVDTSAILSSEMKDHPLLLLPLELRRKILEEKLKNNPKSLDSIRRSFLYQGDISKRNREIYDALLKSYKGNHQEVFKHIRVERFIISRRYSSAAVTIEPQLHVDARLQQITMDRRLSNLPPGLQSLNLFSLHGEVILSNRGVLEFSDLLKRPLDTFKYLLMTMETKTINLQGILTELDIFFVGSSNEIHLSAFKQHPDFNSFKGRFNFIRVPYLLNVREEEMIYQEQVLNLMNQAKFEPNALNTLCLFSCMTRLRPSQVKNFQQKELAKVASSLSPLEKVLLLSYGKVPQRLDSEDRKTLKIGTPEIAAEFEHENLYEGKFGMSPREVKQIIYELASRHEHVTCIEVLEFLTKFIERKNEHDFLNISPQGDYNNSIRFIESLKEYSLDIFDSEVRESLGLVDKRSYEEYIARYVLHISAQIKKEKVKNAQTGKFEDANSVLIKEFELSIGLKEGPDQFRSHLISTLGAYSLDNPGVPIVYTEVFPELVKKLQEAYKEEQKKMVKKVSQGIMFYLAEIEQSKTRPEVPASQLTEDVRSEIKTILKTLQSKFHYSENAALTLLKFLIKERY